MFLIHGSRKRCCMLMCLLLDARINWETHGENFAPEKNFPSQFIGALWDGKRTSLQYVWLGKFMNFYEAHESI